MASRRPTRPARAIPFAPLLVLLVGLCLPAIAQSQGVKPWAPPGQDSLLAWSAESKARFQENRGDSATGANYRAYYLMGNIGRRMLRSIGRKNILQAPAIKSVFDSLGLDAEVTLDPTRPEFVLIMTRNPFKLSADGVGFLYWFRGDDLRLQGLVFRSPMRPQSRVWVTGREAAPYEWGILSQSRGAIPRLGLTLLRLNGDGYYWQLGQFEGGEPDLGSGTASWVDLNGDDLPEIATWVRANFDSSFVECTDCPHLLTERVYVEHASGFDLDDSRLMPSPYSTFVLFVRLLREKNRAAASRLLADPTQIDRAIASGWAAPPTPGQWNVQFAGSDERWPDRLAIRFNGAKSKPLYAVRFAMKDGRWIIHDWSLSGASAATPTRPGTPSR